MRYVSIATVMALAALAPPALAQDADVPSVNRGDFVASMNAEFARLDGDGDGRVTRAEVEASQRQAAQAEALRQNRLVFDRLDADGNGTLTPDEFAQLANPAAIPIDAAPMMAQLDGDGDGLITLVEHRTATQANFDRIDGDRDGVVTPAEMRVAGIIR